MGYCQPDGQASHSDFLISPSDFFRSPYVCSAENANVAIPMALENPYLHKYAI